MSRLCGNCNWWKEEVCCNGESELVAEFRQEGSQACNKWEEIE